MVEFLDADREALFEEIVERGRQEGGTDQEAYHDLAEEVIQEHLNVGEMHDDSPTVDLVEQFRSRFTEYLDRVGLDADRPKL